MPIGMILAKLALKVEYEARLRQFYDTLWSLNVTTPVNSDKSPSLPPALSPTGRDAGAAVGRRPNTDATGNQGASNSPAGVDNKDIDITHGHPMLNLRAPLPEPREGGALQDSTAAQAALHRLQALVNEDPGAALRAQASGLTEWQGSLLEVQPS